MGGLGVAQRLFFLALLFYVRKSAEKKDYQKIVFYRENLFARREYLGHENLNIKCINHHPGGLFSQMVSVCEFLLQWLARELCTSCSSKALCTIETKG